MIYKNLYSKCFYLFNKKPYGHGYLELKVIKNFFHSGGAVIITDGYKDIHVRYYKTLSQLIRLVRHYKKELNK